MNEEEVTSPRPSLAKRIVVRTLFTMLMGIMGVLGIRYYWESRNFQTTDDAFVEGAIIRVSSQVAGRLATLPVSDNQAVTAGTVLAEIDARPYEAALQLKEATVRVSQKKGRTAELAVGVTGGTSDAGIEQAQAGVVAAQQAVEQARAELRAAEAEVQRTRNDVDRYQALADSAISRQRREQAEVAATVARARRDEARKQVSAAEAQVDFARGRLSLAKTGPAQVDVSKSQVDQAEAEAQQAKAAVALAKLDLSYTAITAPVDGRIARKAAQAGEFVQPGQTLMALVSNDLWVVANFKETQLGDMHIGQPVDIHVDAYPGLVLKGHIDSFQAGTGSRFSLLPPENATGNYVKVVQRVPVKIRFDEPIPADYHLGPGMSVVPRVRVQ